MDQVGDNVMTQVINGCGSGCLLPFGGDGAGCPFLERIYENGTSGNTRVLLSYPADTGPELFISRV